MYGAVVHGPLDDPFAAIGSVDRYHERVHAALIDIHAEASIEERNGALVTGKSLLLPEHSIFPQQMPDFKRGDSLYFGCWHVW